MHPLRCWQHLSLLITEGDALQLPPLPQPQQPPPKRHLASGVPSPSRPLPRGVAKARGSRTGDIVRTALQEMVTAPLLPPEEGWVVNPLFPFISVLPSGTHIFNRRAVSIFSGPKEGSESSGRSKTQLLPCVPPRCLSVGTPTVRSPLVPSCAVSASLVSAPQSISLAYSDVRLGYAIQLARRPPKFRGVHFTSVKAVNAHVLRAEIVFLQPKDAIESVLPAYMRSEFYSSYFIVPKKSGGLQPILDLRVLNQSLHKLPFKMLMQKCIFECIRPRDLSQRST